MSPGPARHTSSSLAGAGASWSRTSAVSHILLDTRAEADAWTAYWTESGDER